MDRRMRPFDRLEMSRFVKIGATIYLSISLIILSMAVYMYPQLRIPLADSSFGGPGTMASVMPLVLWAFYFLGLGFIGLLIRKCHRCRPGQGERIAAALDKMGKGDLGWKITLRRGDELAEVADSISRASQSLADRVAGLKSKAEELSGVEEFLLDSIDANEAINPYTLKALRKLKICTNRLISDMDDFQVSTVIRPPAEPKHSIVRETIKA